MYGNGGLKKSALCQLENAKITNLHDDVGSVDKLVETIIDAAFGGKEAQ